MTLNIIKLAVGAESIESMAEWQAGVMATRKAAGLSVNPVHETRMFPKRASEIIGKGSMFWVIKHKIRVRQKIIDIEKIEMDDAPSFCLIHLDPQLVPVRIKHKRPFQGWRYLKDADAPPDVDPTAKPLGDTPAHLELALKDAGVW